MMIRIVMNVTCNVNCCISTQKIGTVTNIKVKVVDSAIRSEWALDSSGWILGRSRDFPLRH
jgi:hypothetical protein